MKNFIAVGNTIDVPIFSVGIDTPVVSGNGYLIGALFGVAQISAPGVAPGSTEVFPLKVTGVFDLPKQASQAWSVGARVYWDAVGQRATTTATGNTLIGVAVAATGGTAGEIVGRVRLNGSVPA